MMTLNELVRLSERMRRLNSRLVKIVGYKTGKDKQGIPTAVAKTYTPLEYKLGLGGPRIGRASDQAKYVSSIKFLDRKMHVRVSCSCPDYYFRFEVANHLVGASDIIYSTGEMPDQSNPEYRPQLCKHLIRLRTLIKEKHNV